MESVSRPPHRRKHSSTNANAFVSFSLKNPYDDILLSGCGKKTKSFGANEYAEIFAGSSSSIPVLDLSGLDERVGSGDGRSSKLDYSSIFGGLRDDDVAMPHEELFNGAKNTKCSSDKPCIQADVGVHLQESGSLHSPGKTQRPSGKSADQSVDEVKQQFNLSFNKTSQRNDDASNRKTHIAQLHDVPGFAYFIDGIHQVQKTEDIKPVPLLKREVSRTWSFSTDLEAVKSKGGLSSDKFHTPDKSHDVTESNLKSHLSNVPLPSSQPSNIKDHNASRGSRLSSFPAKENTSVKIDGESSPPLFEEELDENSVAAISAAALKKAVEQAQESIRIAKMIMDKKRESLLDGSKPRPKGRLKVKDKKENGIELKVRDNVEEAKEHGEAFNGIGKKLATSCSQSEALRNIEKVELERLGKTVEAAEAHKEASYFPESVAKAECRTAILEYGKVVSKNNSSTTNKLASNLGDMETGEKTLERIEITVHHSDGGPEDVTELTDRDLNISRTQELERIVDETLEQRETTVDRGKGPQHATELVERALNNSQSKPVQEKTLDGAGSNLRISQEKKVTKKCHDVTDDQGICENKSEESDEVVNVEHLKMSSLKFDNLMNESPNLDEKEAMEQEEMDMEKKFVNVPECRENGQRHGESMDEEEKRIRQKETHICLESKEQQKEALKEVINESEPEVFPEIKEVENSINEVHEPAAVDDKKLNCLHDGDGKRIQGELEQNAIEGGHMDTIEDKTVETKRMEGNNCIEFEKNEVSRVTNQTNNSLRGAGRSEENEKKSEFQEAAYEIHAEAVSDAKNNDINTFNETHCHNASDSFSETRESCDVDFNNSMVEENDSMPGLTEKCSFIDMDKTEPPFHMEDNDTCTIDSLHRSASEDNFVGSSLHFISEGLPFNNKTENVGVTNPNNEEKVPKDEDIFKNYSEIHNTAQETADKFIFENLPEVHPSDFRTAESDLTDVRLVSEQTSEMDGRSESTSGVENLDGLSINKSKKCAGNSKNETSENENVGDNIEMTSNEMNHAQEWTEGVSSEEQSDGVYSQLHGKPKEMEESMESEKSVERGQILEKNNENADGISTSEEKNAKENVQNFDKEDQQQRIEAIKRGREREKDRIAVERAIREARERAFAEARERAERAAVEKAAAEVRQRVMAETREKLEKVATTSKQPAVKASTEAKLRSERAAVERATAEARERALEKAMSQKISTEGRAYADRYPTEKLSGASRNNALRHSFSSSDLENFDGTINESAQRRKARLERHQRIMERAAKALAEKNMRDLLAQKEQAERNRLAESLDADIKRWVMGKEGNLRALLSTLQYILGPNSGWQPISLTEIITTPAVKKAYRKATLYVHPDKLQQRGASIQQKYICEKVFDLLKAAWNRFNSEER